MKKLIAAFLLVVMAVCFFSTAAFAIDPELKEGEYCYTMLVPADGADDPPIFVYYLNEDGEAEIRDVFGTMYYLYMPSTINGHKITAIADDAFSYVTSLQYIAVPRHVKSIGKYAFNGCSSLEEVVLPASLESIGDHAFANCVSLKTVNIPENIKEIPEYAFSCCLALTDVTMHDGIEAIGEKAFSMCMNLTELAVPEGAAVAEDAFENSALADDAA